MNSELPAKESDPTQMREELQSWWEIASIAQYVSLFRFSFQLPEIEIEELEDGLIEDATEEGSSWLRNFIVSLLRGILSSRGVTFLFSPVGIGHVDSTGSHLAISSRKDFPYDAHLPHQPWNFIFMQ
ncbi:uncharacterized protein LOC118205445 [Stegodyphus dumicola]|uniref:uncharacterized protein LOC118205445 n=1 Tax=Stegodyphus dumicola TaxID=202533 RepID=UPI0015B06FEC|nr:uncharacterized protein LOC118205445 [Stegodyphus dumicola]